MLFLCLAGIPATSGWSRAGAAEPNAITKFLSNVNRRACYSYKIKIACKALPKPAAAKGGVPVPRAKPEAIQKLATTAPRAGQGNTLASTADATCLQRLRSAGAEFTVATASAASSQCQIRNPVNLLSVKTRKYTVELPDTPLLNCRFALQFSKWVSKSATPILETELQTPLKNISTGPGFECRKRDNSAKPSEHGSGNAVDIAAFAMRDGRSINVQDAKNPGAESFTVLRGLRSSACGFFTTVLGPGSNADHERHFHFDLGPHGNNGDYRICE